MEILKQHEVETNFLFKSDGIMAIFDTMQLIREKQFSISDVGVTNRWITNWSEKDILLGEHEAGKWRKFNFSEYVWLKMIIEMRKYNIPLNLIKHIRDILGKGDFYKELDLEKAVVQLKDMGINTEGFKEILDEILKEDLFNKIADEVKFTFLESLILDILKLKSQTSLIFNEKGEVGILKHGFEDYLLQQKSVQNILKGSYISISVTNILADFILEKDQAIVFDKLQMISKEESKVIKTLRNEGLKSVKVLLKNEEIELIESTYDKKVDYASKLVHLIMNKGYQEIKIKTENGNIVYCENTIKEKI